MVEDWRVSSAGPMLIYWPKKHNTLLSSKMFLFVFFLFIGLYCGEVFGLIMCRSLSTSLALPTSFNNNNTINKNNNNNMDLSDFFLFRPQKMHLLTQFSKLDAETTETTLAVI